MKRSLALVGDRNDAVIAHRAIPEALRLASQVELEARWLPTDAIRSDEDLAGFDAFWCVPASPYRSMEGALRAIRYAREQERPFLGTCGGFQHAVVEYARNVLGWSDAEHAETAPEAARPVIVPLSCSLVEVSDSVQLLPGSRLSQAYGTATVSEGYHCNYGLSAEFLDALKAGPLRANAVDDAGDVRGVELDGHPFFVATLFQPERAALGGRIPPVVRAFVDAVAGRS